MYQKLGKDYSITFDGSLSLDKRRLNVINKMRQKATLNWTNLRQLIKENIENVPFYIINNSHAYTFKVCVASDNIAQLQQALKQARPAYLTFTIEVVDIYERNCGTFECGTNPL